MNSELLYLPNAMAFPTHGTHEIGVEWLVNHGHHMFVLCADLLLHESCHFLSIASCGVGPVLCLLILLVCSGVARVLFKVAGLVGLDAGRSSQACKLQVPA